MTTPTDEKTDLTTPPQPVVKRLNRGALYAIGSIVVLIFWAGAFVMTSRSPLATSGSGALKAPPQLDPQKMAQIERFLAEGQRLAAERLRDLQALPDGQAQPGETPVPGAAFQNLTHYPAPSDLVKNGWPSARARVPGEEDLEALETAPPGSPLQSSSARQGGSIERAYGSPVLAAEFTRSATRTDARPAGSASPDLSSLPFPPMPPLSLSGPQEERPADPNLLERKDAFLKSNRDRRDWRLGSSLQPMTSPFEVKAGALLPATLLVGIDSDLPGETSALIRRNVYDSVTGRYLLIPQGTRLLGSYDNRVAYGQRRVLLAWNRLLFPDGRSMDLAGMPGADLAGASGLADRVDSHFLRAFGHALLLSAISAGAQLSQPQESADGRAPSASQIVAAALGQELSSTANALLNRELNVQPTLEIRPGFLFNVEVTADMLFPAPYMSSDVEDESARR